MRVRALALAALVGCYSPTYRDCEITCASRTCPSGLECIAGYCRTSSSGPSCGGQGDPDASVCPGTLESCGGTCVDLLTSSKQCGRCDRDCLSTECDRGVCAVTQLAAAVAAPSKLVAGDGLVVFAAGRYDNCPTTSAVFMLPTNGGAGLSFDGYCTTALALAPGRLYIGELARVSGFATDGTSVGTLSIPSGAYVGGLGASTGDVHVGLHNPEYGVIAVPPSLSGSTPVYGLPPRKVNDVLRLPSSVWFANHDDAESFRRVNRMGPSGEAFVEVTRTDGRADIAFGFGRVFVSEDAGLGRLRSFAEDGTDGIDVVAQSAGIIEVVADDDGVYWAQRSTTPGVAWDIMGRRHVTGDVEVLAREIDQEIRGMAIDGPYLFWLTSSVGVAPAGSLFRVVK